MRLLVVLCVVMAVGCNDNRPRGADAGPSPSDAGTVDADMLDAGPTDAGPLDAEPVDAGPVDAGPPDAGWPPGTTCTPDYACPEGARFEIAGTNGRCMFDVTPPPGAEPYCAYLDDGYLGYFWRLPAAPHTCPPESRDAPNGTLGFCLYEDLILPSGATEACDDLTRGRIGFQWRCP